MNLFSSIFSSSLSVSWKDGIYSSSPAVSVGVNRLKVSRVRVRIRLRLRLSVSVRPVKEQIVGVYINGDWFITLPVPCWSGCSFSTIFNPHTVTCAYR